MNLDSFFSSVKTIIIIFIFYGNSTNSEETYRSRPSHSRQKRSVVNLYQMVKCSTNCDPVSYKGYGCYCGFMGDGFPVDEIDKCCQIHDKCYSVAAVCTSGLHYFTPYDFKCNNGEAICRKDLGYSRSANCGNLLCECDRAFVTCLKTQPCPSHRPVCTTSPWRYIQNRLLSFLDG